jgi:hypothetical protein
MEAAAATLHDAFSGAREGQTQRNGAGKRARDLVAPMERSELERVAETWREWFSRGEFDEGAAATHFDARGSRRSAPPSTQTTSSSTTG